MSDPQNLKVLIVDDLLEEFERYRSYLAANGYQVFGAGSVSRALETLSDIPIDVVLTDMHLTPAAAAEGLTILAEIKANHPHVCPVAMSSDPRVDLAEKAKACGALYFLRKPIATADELVITIRNALSTHRQLSTTACKKPVVPLDLAQRCYDGILISDEHRKLCQAVAGHKEIPVVICGETGTGKEELAKIIHKMRETNESSVPFVALNCANINGDLAASMLFGHKKGAFTGAHNSSVGAVAAADGGILFLDEIHHLPMEAQRRLLRVMNDGSYSRVGETNEYRSSFQVIVASTKDLDDAVDDGSFLIDLRMRLTGIEILLAPLRDRLSDIEPLVHLFFSQHRASIAANEITKIIDRCQRYYWRGNIRQLFKVLQTMTVVAQLNDTAISAAAMPEFKTMLPPKDPQQEPPTPHTAALSPEGQEAITMLKQATTEDVALEDVLKAVEKFVIKATLDRHKKVAEVYSALGISRTNLDVKRKRHGL